VYFDPLFQFADEFFGLIQQAVHQVLDAIFDPTFSDDSYGFRPKRSAIQAVKKAKIILAV